MNATLQEIVVLKVLLRHGELYGREMLDITDIRSGTLYPLLRRLTARGWLSRRAEKGDERALRRRRRYYYKLTSVGVAAYRTIIRAIDVGVFP